jgi:hypothetical protein
MLSTISAPLFAARPTAARLLPENTVMMFSVGNVRVLAEKFMNTNLGRMSQDPQLKPLFETLYGSLNETVDAMKAVIGLSLSDIVALPQGEITYAFVATEEHPLACVFIFDAGDQIANARTLVNLFKKSLNDSDRKVREETIGDVLCTIYEQNDGDQANTIILFEKDSAIALCQTIEVAKQVLDLWNEKKGARSLAENAAYAAIANRCRGTKDEEPQFVWFVDPVGIMKGVARDNLEMQLALAALPALGVDGLSGVGGSVILDTEQYDSIVQLHVALASPRTGAIKAVAFEPGSTKPERWTPSDVASYATVHWNFEKSLGTVEKIYDSFHAEGDFAKNFDEFNKETGVDLQKEIVPALDGRVTYINWIEKTSAGPNSQYLVAFKLKDKEKAVETIQKLLEIMKKKDEQGNIKTKSFAGNSYYYSDPPAPSVPEGAEPPPMQKTCVGILEDYLLISSHEGVYRQVLTTAAGEAKSLEDELDYKLVARKLERVAGENKPAMFFFQRPEETFRYLYELATSDSAKAGIRQEAEGNPMWGSINSALEKNPLPPFSVLQKYLSPAGSVVIDDETGIHFMHFTLKRKGE